jgi:hypothetical protein
LPALESKFFALVWRGDTSFLKEIKRILRPEDYDAFLKSLIECCKLLPDCIAWLFTTTPARKIEGSDSNEHLSISEIPVKEEDVKPETDVFEDNESDTSQGDSGGHFSPSKDHRLREQKTTMKLQSSSSSTKESSSSSKPSDLRSSRSREAFMSPDTAEVIPITEDSFASAGLELLATDENLYIPAFVKRYDGQSMIDFYFAKSKKQESETHKLARVLVWDAIKKAVKNGPYESDFIAIQPKYHISGFLQKLTQLAKDGLTSVEHGMKVSLALTKIHSIGHNQSLDDWHAYWIQEFADLNAISERMARFEHFQNSLTHF